MNKKILTLNGLLLATSCCPILSAATLDKNNLEVVIASNASPTVRFAANETTNFLSQTLGCSVPLVVNPGVGKAHLFLGTNTWSEAAGVSIDNIARDGFVILTKGNDVYIAGDDDLNIDPVERIKNPWWGSHCFNHGTLNGVYYFLEKFGDVRFYFPGELGTCISKKESLRIPEGKIVKAPEHTIRRWSFYSDGPWLEGEDMHRAIHPMKALNILRNMCSTKNYGCCHGLIGFMYPERFGETHPEYFALDRNGKRMIYGRGWKRGHLCFSSGIREEIFKDCLSYLKGEDASVRRIPNRHSKGRFGWNFNTTDYYIDLMPQDGHAMCYCENCKKLLRKDGRDYPATELVWGLLAEVAQRLKKEGYEPTFTMMSYADYGDLPDCSLPTNLKVMVAKTGPWMNNFPGNIKADVDYYKKWERRLGEKTWIWTYPLRGETSNFNVPGWAPRAWGRYYKEVAPHLFGMFAQSEADRCIDNLLSYYIFSKIGWDSSVDVDYLIDEFYKRMFESAADDMRKALDIIEEKFVDHVVGRLQMTDIGPVADRPGEYNLWVEVYSEKDTERIKRFFDDASSKVQKDSLAAKRINLFRKWMLEPIISKGKEYRDSIDVKKGIEYFKSYEKENLLGDDWWVAPDHGASRDKDVTIVSKESKKLTIKAPRTSAWALLNRMKKGCVVEPGETYCLSWFTKVNLKPTNCGGGAAIAVNLGGPNKWSKSWNVPGRLTYHSGNVDWIRQSTEFTVPKDAPLGTTCSIMPFVRWARGEVWFDGLLLHKVRSRGNRE